MPRVGYKIKKLINEGYPQNQAVAIALKYDEQGLLGPRGGLLKRKTGKRSTKKKTIKRKTKTTKRKTKTTKRKTKKKN